MGRTLGICGLGLAISLGLIGIFLTRGGPRRFATGFVVTAILAIVTMILVFVALKPEFNALFLVYLDGILGAVPRRLIDRVTWLDASGLLRRVGAIHRLDASGVPRSGLSLTAAIFIEVAIGFPLLLVALAGGFLALLVRRRERPNPVQNPT